MSGAAEERTKEREGINGSVRLRWLRTREIEGSHLMKSTIANAETPRENEHVQGCQASAVSNFISLAKSEVHA